MKHSGCLKSLEMMVEAYILYLKVDISLTEYWCKRHFLLRQIEIQTYSNSAPICGYWCMYAYLYLSKHNKDLKKQNSIPLMYLVLFDNPL